jgi:hypothetical protein
MQYQANIGGLKAPYVPKYLDATAVQDAGFRGLREKFFSYFTLHVGKPEMPSLVLIG